VLFFEMLTGQLPFRSSDRETLLEMQRSAPPPKPRSIRNDVNPAAEAITLRLLEKDIRKRQRDIGDVRIELESALAARSSASVVMQAPAVHASRSLWSRWAVPALFAIVGAAAGIGVWTMVRPASSTTSGETVSCRSSAVHVSADAIRIRPRRQECHRRGNPSAVTERKTRMRGST
jgi:serine/threonine protein kinase